MMIDLVPLPTDNPLKHPVNVSMQNASQEYIFVIVQSKLRAQLQRVMLGLPILQTDKGPKHRMFNFQTASHMIYAMLPILFKLNGHRFSLCDSINRIISIFSPESN